MCAPASFWTPGHVRDTQADEGHDPATRGSAALARYTDPHAAQRVRLLDDYARCTQRASPKMVLPASHNVGEHCAPCAGHPRATGSARVSVGRFVPFGAPSRRNRSEIIAPKQRQPAPTLWPSTGTGGGRRRRPPARGRLGKTLPKPVTGFVRGLQRCHAHRRYQQLFQGIVDQGRCGEGRRRVGPLNPPEGEETNFKKRAKNAPHTTTPTAHNVGNGRQRKAKPQAGLTHPC